MSTLKTSRIETTSGDGVDVVGLSKVEDTGKNICTAWVSFDGQTTPPTILDSFNVSSVDRAATGDYTVNFLTPMDNTNFIVVGTTKGNRTFGSVLTLDVNSVRVLTYAGADASAIEIDGNCVTIFGGKA